MTNFRKCFERSKSWYASRKTNSSINERICMMQMKINSSCSKRKKINNRGINVTTALLSKHITFKWPGSSQCRIAVLANVEKIIMILGRCLENIKTKEESFFYSRRDNLSKSREKKRGKIITPKINIYKHKNSLIISKRKFSLRKMGKKTESDSFSYFSK